MQCLALVAKLTARHLAKKAVKKAVESVFSA